jgi:hypothetical protein
VRELDDPSPLPGHYQRNPTAALDGCEWRRRITSWSGLTGHQRSGWTVPLFPLDDAVEAVAFVGEGHNQGTSVIAM